jgi:uncharacterized protein YecE (DUF72 family)
MQLTRRHASSCWWVRQFEGVSMRDDAASVGAIRIGVSGWRYAPWRGVFYPPDLAQARELAYTASKLPTLEINGSFYSLQRPESWQSWYDDTPAGFVFAVKGSRYITHMRKLRDVRVPLANFFASGIFNLREKLGPILWQFPPVFRYERARMAAFFELLPVDAAAALKLARSRDARVLGRARLAIDENRPLRHAIEVRHESFLDPAFVELLRQHRIALVTAETAGRWPLAQSDTADFVYLRLHGDRELYKSGYGERALDKWARRIRAWSRGRPPSDVTLLPPAVSTPRPHDVYCYFDNTDEKLRAPADALRLMRKLGVEWPVGTLITRIRASSSTAKRSGPQLTAHSPQPDRR